MNKKAQVSVEYLLLLLIFFSALAITIPSISYAVNAYFSANDSILAKNIAKEMNEECSLFDFLANGSEKTFEFIPTKHLAFSTNQKQLLVVSSSEKEFETTCKTNSLVSNDFSKKFFITLKKENNFIVIYFQS